MSLCNLWYHHLEILQPLPGKLFKNKQLSLNQSETFLVSCERMSYKLIISFDFPISNAKPLILWWNWKARQFLLIAEKQVDRQRFRTQDQGNNSHTGSLTLDAIFLDLLPWLKLVVNDEGRLDMGVFFIRSVLKIITIILVLRKNRSQRNYCFHHSLCRPPFCFVADW